jgi:HD superfamily phosphohydrolase
MGKIRHELRDVIHDFVHFNNVEKSLVDSAPFQRLRSIHQLAMSYEVYPGATHRRFEHSLGVMEVAGRIFDAVFDSQMDQRVLDRISEELHGANKIYWRNVLRAGALLHDVGHLPFSHAAEKFLLPEEWDHERMTAEIIRNSELKGILENPSPPMKVEDVIDVAWDFRKRKNATLTPWKTLLNEIITGNTFGADRIDYLLRDSYHVGVPYGTIDPSRLISGLRVTIDPSNNEIALGLDSGSLHPAEALLLARYFMYVQVYLHSVRRIYDIHLKDFLLAYLPGGKFSVDWKEFLKVTDDEILSALRLSVTDTSDKNHELACRVIGRKHFRTVYELISPHKVKCPTILDEAVQFARDEFGEENVRSDRYAPKSEENDFLVIMDDGSIESSLDISSVVPKLPTLEIGLIFLPPSLRVEGEKKIRTFVEKRLAES